MRLKNLVGNSLATLVALTLLVDTAPATASATAADLTKMPQKTHEAVVLFRQGKLQEAAALAQTAVVAAPDNWLSHATLSYLAWQQGNVLLALDEAEESNRLSSGNLVALTNLAKMKDALEDSSRAIKFYEQAAKLAPEDCSVQLGIARSYYKLGQSENALAVLTEMLHRPDKDFDWYYQVADAYLQFGKPDLAAQATTKAIKVAVKSEQVSAGTTQLLLALLRDGQFERAKALRERVFRRCHPDNYELYVRAASTLLPAANPASATNLVNAAVANLLTVDNAEGFYRLGRVFEDRSSSVSYDVRKHDDWLKHAGVAYRRAVALDPMQARYQLALAGILDQQGEKFQALAALNQAKMLDPMNKLPPAVVAKIAANEAPAPAKLSSVRFSIKGITCGCRVTKVQGALSKIDGVAFANISYQQSYEGLILVDESLVSTNEVFSRCRESFGSDPNLKIPELITFEVISSEKVDSMENAVRIAQNAQYGDPLQFYVQLRAVEPVMPVPGPSELASSSN